MDEEKRLPQDSRSGILIKMEKIVFSAKELGRIRKAGTKRMETLLNVTLEIAGNSIVIESRTDDSFNEYLAASILEAVGFGFDIDRALMLRNIDHILRKIELKADRRKNIIAGRLIGTRGRTKKAMERVSGCEIIITDHVVGILGKSGDVEVAAKAILAIIRGAPQGKAVSGLEKDKARLRRIEDDVEKFIENNFL